MLESVSEHIAANFSELYGAKLLIAVSGGVDSIVLGNLCNTLGLQASWAHCNFGLRGSESDLDQEFVIKAAQALSVPVFVERFDTLAFAKASKYSTQIAARMLRYEWFASLCKSENFDFILTAHHANDALETFLINLGRNTGLKGLCSIPERNANIRRVLLPFSRKQIENYACTNQLVWREDKSNASNAYLRNQLRHYAVPALIDAMPNLIASFSKTRENLQQDRLLLEDYTAQLQAEIMYPVNSVSGAGYQVLALDKLNAYKNKNAILRALLETYQFTSWENVYALLEAQTGKEVISKTHRLVRNRNQLLLIERYEKTNQEWQWGDLEQQLDIGHGVLHCKQITTGLQCSTNEIIVDAEQLTLPLKVRTWQHGDVFYPFGMTGKKKISKFLKDLKRSSIQKEQVKVLCSDNKIVWVIGLRADRRFSVTETSSKIYKIKFNDQKN